jgi:outer membrane murein-binding lipoprotein Lpp
MSVPVRVLTVAVLAAGLVIPSGSAHAQTVAEQRARVEQLQARVRALAAQRAAQDSARRAERRLDTLVVGGLTLVTDSSRSTTLRAAAADAWQTVVADLGADPADLRGALIYVRLGSPEQSWSDLLGPTTEFVQGDRRAPGESLRQRLRAAAGMALAARAGHTLSLWSGGALGLQVTPDASFDRAAMELVTTLSVRVRQCNAGDMASCALALGVTPVSDPLTAWYDASDRQALVRREIAGAWRRRMPPSVDDCAERGSDAACLAYLGETWGKPYHPPLSTEAAVGVLFTAARLGGNGALNRLLADTTASLPTRLVAMAGVPLDSLLTTWRAEARAHRTSSPTLPGPTRWAALFWIVAFGTMALGNPRWR